MPGSFFHDSRAVLYDADGNPVTVILDAEGNYRLAVDAVLGDNLTEAMGTREAVAVSYPEMLKVLERITSQLDIVLRHFAAVTGEDDPL
jgi:hypothetical protein